jgi:mercuric ion binding protein
MNITAFTRRMVAALSIALLSSGAFAAPPIYRLHVDGLACPFCAYGLEKKLGALPGVQGLETRIEDGTVIVTMTDGAMLDAASAKQAVKEAGFSLHQFEQLQSPPPSKPAGPAK